MLRKFLKLKVHKVLKSGLALSFIHFLSFQLTIAQIWAPVGSGIMGVSPNTTWTLCSYDSVLFAGGWFNNAGGINAANIAQWNGVQWDSVGLGSSNVYINAMAVYNGYLYVGGAFTGIGGVAANDIARWNGSNWMPVGAGLKGGDYGINTMCVYNGKLYVGGSFDSSGSKAIYALAQWNDTTWSALGTGVSAADEDDGVFALAVYNGELYAAGDFVVSGGTNIAVWDGASFSAPGGGTTGPVYSLAVYEDKLYVGGMITQAGGMQANCIAAWNSANWSFPDSGIWGENTYAIVNALTVYDNELYAGGYFDTVNGKPINCIAKWNGSNWSEVGSGINVGGAINAMTVYNNSLYVGGGFDSAGGVYAKNIATWTVPTSIKGLTTSNYITVYPDPANTDISIKLNDPADDWFYTIYTELGEQVATGKLNSTDITHVNITGYTNGIYFLSIDGADRKYNTKFIKN